MDIQSLRAIVEGIVGRSIVTRGKHDDDWNFVELPFQSPYKSFLNAHFFAFRGAYRKTTDQYGNTSDVPACIVLKDINYKNVTVEKTFVNPYVFEGDVILLFRVKNESEAVENLQKVIGILQQVVSSFK